MARRRSGPHGVWFDAYMRDQLYDEQIPCYEAQLEEMAAGSNPFMRLARPHPLLGALLGLLLAGALALVDLTRPADHGPVYTVAQVRAGLAGHPRAWVARPLRLRGIAFACTPWPRLPHDPCVGWRPGIGDAGDPDQSARLPIASGALAWLSMLRRVPAVGWLVPAPQTIQWGAEATYRVRLRTSPPDRCPSPPCFQAVLLDATP